MKTNHIIYIVIIIIAFVMIYGITMKTKRLKDISDNNFQPKTFCVQGYVFVSVKNNRSISIQQVFENVNGKPLPMECSQ